MKKRLKKQCLVFLQQEWYYLLEQLWLLQEATGVADTTEISEMMVFAEIAVYVQKRISKWQKIYGYQ